MNDYNPVNNPNDPKNLNNLDQSDPNNMYNSSVADAENIDKSVASGDSINNAQTEEEVKKRRKAPIIIAIALFLIIVLFVGFCATRRTSKSKDVVLPATTSQNSNNAGQLVDNLMATPTPTPFDPTNPNNPGAVDPALAANGQNPQNAQNPNLPGGPRYAENTGLYQQNQPVTNQTGALNQQAQAMTERGNNPKNVPQSPYQNRNAGYNGGGGNGGSNYSGGGYYNGGGSQNPVQQITDAAQQGIANLTNAGENSAPKRSKAVFYGSTSNASGSTQVAQMSNILAARNLNFNSIPFGTLLPVRTIGAVHTLLPSALARLELTQTVKGDGWTLPAGTIIVGQVSEGIGNRVSITPRGFLLNDQLYPIQGEISGTDGGVGLVGDRKTVGSKWYRSLLEVADRAQQSFNSWLAGRNGGNITNIQYPSVSQMVNANPGQNVNYVAVKPNATGYLLVTQLPSNQGTVGGVNNFNGGGGRQQGLNAIPSSIPGMSLDDVNNILASGDDRAIQNLLSRKP